MNRTVYQKLVRDRIPEIIRQSGAEPVCRALTRAEILDALKDKLCEEALEFKESGAMEELADVQEVMNAILDVMAWSEEEVEEVRAQKYRERGGFAQGIWLQEVRR